MEGSDVSLDLQPIEKRQEVVMRESSGGQYVKAVLD